MLVALVLAWAALAVIVFQGVSFIVYDLTNPTSMWYGLGLLGGAALLIPSAVVVVFLGIVMGRFNWARVAFSIAVFLWAVTWFTFVAGGAASSLWTVTVAVGALSLTVILMWVPANRLYFRHQPRGLGWMDR